MRPLAESAARVSKRPFSRKFVSLGRIVTHWTDIVGENFACKAQPVKIRYRKADKGEAPDACLEIASSGADSTLLHYQKDLILERINHIFGERWVTAIRFIALPAGKSFPKMRPVAVPLNPGEKNYLSDMLTNVSDPDIRNRLDRLGRAILTEERRAS